MAKDPAFLFYASDFWMGISGLTMEERGQYISLLCLQHQKGHLSEKEIRLCVGNATADVMAKFTRDENGLYFNKRLDIEIAKRREHSEKQKQRAKDGWEKRKKEAEATAIATALPLEDVSINENDTKDLDDSLILLKNEDLEIENFSPEFIAYKDWAARNFPDLLKFDKPLTDKQLHSLFDEFKDKTLVREKLEALGNKRKAKTDYKTVYATCRNWCKRDLERGYVSKDTIQQGQDVWSKTHRILDKVAAERYGNNQQNQLT